MNKLRMGEEVLLFPYDVSVLQDKIDSLTAVSKLMGHKVAYEKSKVLGNLGSYEMIIDTGSTSWRSSFVRFYEVPTEEGKFVKDVLVYISSSLSREREENRNYRGMEAKEIYETIDSLIEKL